MSRLSKMQIFKSGDNTLCPLFALYTKNFILYHLIYSKCKADDDDKLRTCEIKWLEPSSPSTLTFSCVRTVSVSNDPFKTC